MNGENPRVRKAVLSANYSGARAGTLKSLLAQLCMVQRQHEELSHGPNEMHKSRLGAK